MSHDFRSSDGNAGFYSAEWHTGASRVHAGGTYQISVFLDGRAIGRTYVELRDHGDADVDDAGTVVVGQTLPVRFRIERVSGEEGDTIPRLVVAVDSGVVAGVPLPADTVLRFGQRVRYRFTAAPGYENLLVMVDGQYVSPRGTVTMDGAHTIVATADRVVAAPQGDILVDKARALLTAQDPASAYQQYLDAAARVYREAGDAEADHRIAVADYLAFDPVADEDALMRLDSALAGHVFTVGAVSVQSSARRSAAVDVPANPTTMFYVNGVLNTPLDAVRSANKLQQLVNESGASNVTSVRLVYNRTWQQQLTPVERRVHLCVQDMSRSRGFRGSLSLDTRFSQCMGSYYYLYNLDLAECVRQVLQLSGGGSSAVETDARTVADSVLHYMRDVKQNVILVPHSQGNLMTEQALNVVHADPRYQNGGGECLSVASIAAPTSRGLSLEEGRDLWAFIINHDVLDALLHMNTFQHIDTPLSRSVDAELAFWKKLSDYHVPGAGTMLSLKTVTEGLAIHSATDSYMSAASPESRTLLRENIETLATRNCHRYYGLVGNYFASDPQYGCFAPLYIRVTEREDGSVWLDQWDWGYNSAFHGVVASKGGSYAYTAHVLYSDRATNPEWLEEDYTWNMVLTPRPDGTYLGEVDATHVERASWRSWTYKSSCTTELTRTYD